MSIGISKLFDAAERFADQRRLTLAIEAWEEARRLTKIPDRRAWASFNLGVMHWARFGNGEAARREFLSAAAEFDAHGYGQIPQLKMLHAGAIENAMLCALSFDEFDELAGRLRALTPDMPILAGLVPVVYQEREEGKPWSDLLIHFAYNYYSRNDPKLDRGRYGEAKSTYHLLLFHRRALRLSRDDWSLVVFEYCALAQRMVVDCMTARGGDSDSHPPDEYLPILTDALPLVDEYLIAQSGDERVREVREGMQSMITNSRGRWEELSRQARQTTTRRVRCSQCGWPIRPYEACPNCGGSSIPGLSSIPMPTPTAQGTVFNLLMLLSPFVGFGVGKIIGGWSAAAIGLFVGMFVGVIGLSWFFFVKGVRGMKCATCGRLFRKGQDSTSFDLPGVMISTAALMDGSQGVGYECKKCDRTYCSDCQPMGGECKCGSMQFRTKRLIFM
jgi:hypothetical protein